MATAILEKWGKKQKEAFSKAVLGGAFMDFVASRGGTGELREPITQAEFERRKKRRKIAKASRQRNRR